MRVDPRQYSRRGKGARTPIMVNVRLRRAKRLGKPTARDVRDALQTILDTGVVPAGWQFAAIDWRRPAAANSDWRGPGTAVELDTLGAVLQAELRRARVAIVRDVDSELSPPPFKSNVVEEL